MAKSRAEMSLLAIPPENAPSGKIARPNHLTAFPKSEPQMICPVCGSRAALFFSLPHTAVFRCSAGQCMTQFAHPQLDDRTLSQAYENLYYPNKTNGSISHLENTPDAVLRQVLSQLQQHIGQLAGLRVLDYGCGVGSLLRVAADLGARSVGVEPDPEARLTAATVTGLPVYENLEHLSASESEKPFDLVVLLTVIEHLRRPWEDLARLRRLLSPGGWLLVSTINIRCVRAQIRGQRWEQYRNPTHFYYFDSRSLARVIQKAGFSHFSPWPLRIQYPHHGALRRLLYYAAHAAGLADGLFFLCRNTTRQSEEAFTPHIARQQPAARPYSEGT
jgi:2-polyprenyl-3-methyl-5-hydroxy-6-metoxy-1,4-benzoquinol methylase